MTAKMNLTRESDLAEQLDKPVEWVAQRRRKDRWPHVRPGRFDVRYTDAQIEQIVAQYTVTPKAIADPPRGAPLMGQTKRSIARNRP